MISLIAGVNGGEGHEFKWLPRLVHQWSKGTLTCFSLPISGSHTRQGGSYESNLLCFLSSIVGFARVHVGHGGCCHDVRQPTQSNRVARKPNKDPNSRTRLSSHSMHTAESIIAQLASIPKPVPPHRLSTVSCACGLGR
jgi:hypothetical protein